MRRRTVMILTLALMLVVPALVAAASSGFESVGSPAVTADRVQAQSQDCGECVYESMSPDRDQVRDRGQDRAEQDADQNRIQEQEQLRIHDPAAAASAEQIRTREQARDHADCDGDGVQLREQARTEAQRELKLEEPQGERQGFGPETGNGPVAPEVGVGSQFGRSGR